MKLYEITQQYEQLLDEIANTEDGEINEENLISLTQFESDFEEKAIAVASYIKNIEAEEQAINNAINEMKNRKDKLTKKAQSLSDYLQYNLTLLSISEIKSSPYFNIKLKQCPQSVEVIDEEIIPTEYWREKITKSLDKMMIKECLNKGIEIPGASIQRKIKLEIK